MEQKFRLFLEFFTGRQVWLYTAAACFHILLSLIPASLLALAALTVLPFGGALTALLQALVPPELLGLLLRLTGMIGRRHSISLLSVSALLALWSVSRALLSIQTGLDHMLGIQSRRGYVFRRLRSILPLLALVLVPVFLLLLHLVDGWLLPVIAELTPGIAALLSFLLRRQWLIGFLLLSLTGALVYYAAPSVRSPVLPCLLCGMAVSAAWQLISLLFSVYMAYISSYPALYGTVGAVFLGLIWLQLSIRTLFLGARLLEIVQK